MVQKTKFIPEKLSKFRPQRKLILFFSDTWCLLFLFFLCHSPPGCAWPYPPHTPAAHFLLFLISLNWVTGQRLETKHSPSRVRIPTKFHKYHLKMYKSVYSHHPTGMRKIAEQTGSLTPIQEKDNNEIKFSATRNYGNVNENMIDFNNFIRIFI